MLYLLFAVSSWFWKGLIILFVVCSIVFIARSVTQIGRPNTNEEEDYDENSYS